MKFAARTLAAMLRLCSAIAAPAGISTHPIERLKLVKPCNCGSTANATIAARTVLRPVPHIKPIVAE